MLPWNFGRFENSWLKKKKEKLVEKEEKRRNGEESVKETSKEASLNWVPLGDIPEEIVHGC